MKNENVKLMLGDNIEKLRELPDNFVDSIITDPPYGLSFMGKKWDYDVPSVEFWEEALRVLKPGGHVLSFGGTRTYHRMVVNMEDAGFEIRDQIMWVYGSGFPKSHNIGKAVDKIEGNEREVVGDSKRHGGGSYGMFGYEVNNKETKGQSDYEGWGTALKPANEPICVARKPLSEKTIAENVLKHGTGGINIDGCRIEFDIEKETPTGDMYYYINNKKYPNQETSNSKIMGSKTKRVDLTLTEGRFPANLIFDETAAELLDEQSGDSKSQGGKGKATQKSLDRTDIGYGFKEIDNAAGLGGYGDTGGASRFFYVAKVSKKERNLGLDGFEDKSSVRVNAPRDNEEEKTKSQKNNHPTIKPINLLTYLVRLITPQNGIVMDCYMGSGSTGIAALLEGFQFIGMEMDEEYFNIAEARIDSWEQYKDLIKKK
jgi:site-specific DNA-methyltransferase (adenine-specific)